MVPAFSASESKRFERKRSGLIEPGAPGFER